MEVDSSNHLCEATSVTRLPARWRAMKRRLGPSDPLFEEGTILCNMHQTKWTVHGEDDNKYDITRKAGAMEVDSSNHLCEATSVTRLPARWRAMKRRLGPSDPLFEEGTILCNMHQTKWTVHGEDDNKYDITRLVKEFSCHEKGCKKTFDNLTSYERHYHVDHSHVCATCRRQFPTSHLLDIHLLEWHDAFFSVRAQTQPMYCCLLEACKEKFMTPGQRKNHMITTHKYPAIFRFHKPRKTNVKSKSTAKNRTTPPSTMSMETEITADVCSADDVSKRGDDVTERGDDVMRQKTDERPNPVAESRFKYSYKVPKNVCFGQGSQKGFQRRGRGRGRHWHQMSRPDQDTRVQLEDVNLGDLLDAMDT